MFWKKKEIKDIETLKKQAECNKWAILASLRLMKETSQNLMALEKRVEELEK